jgi:6-phosphogluconolactonase
VDPTAQFAFVANYQDNTVSGYRIDRKTGSLTPVPGSPFPAAGGPGPDSVAVDTQFVYETGSDSLSVPGTVSGYRIDCKTGALTLVSGSPFQAGIIPFSVAIDPAAEFTYVANSDDNTISGYRIDRKTGALTPVPGSPFATEMGPIGLAVDPRAPFVYVANIGSNTVSIYSINRETGALTLAGSLATGNEPFSVAITGH